MSPRTRCSASFVCDNPACVLHCQSKPPFPAPESRATKGAWQRQNLMRAPALPAGAAAPGCLLAAAHCGEVTTCRTALRCWVVVMSGSRLLLALALAAAALASAPVPRSFPRFRGSEHKRPWADQPPYEKMKNQIKTREVNTAREVS